MSSTQNVGNNVGAVSDFQLRMEALDLAGAHGKKNRKLEQGSTSILSHSCNGQKITRMDQSQNTEKLPERQLPNPVTTCKSISKPEPHMIAQEKVSNSVRVFRKLVDKQGVSKEAKAVYTAASGILSEVSKCEDFSATNIQEAISAGLNNVANTKDLKGTVGLFVKSEDDCSKTGQSSLSIKKDEKWEPDGPRCINAGRNLELSQWGTAGAKNIQNAQIKIKFDSKKTNDYGDVYNVQFNNNIGKPFKIYCPKDFPIEKYSDQLCAEASTYSGDITIKKAEPGSVFVRVFGKGQSPLRPCWCNAGDINSAVTNAKDLYDKLAVKFEWNGDGNMAVLVVPNDIEIYFAEGTIASQIGEYSETIIKDKEDVEQKHTYIFQGGGIQTNILAKNVSEGYRPFADQTDAKIWNNIMFVFHDDGIIDIQELSQPPAQNFQKSEQK